MVAALYRRYRPDSFAEMIGQAQVTEPLMTALRSGRVNHAYLFSGPRGCGKTSSARILARCMNCAQGPTDTPCGTCPSCVELARDGSGSLDVIEIDAASHGGVEDARDLRERAVLAPSRDRYKIFIIDEAHMVTAAGFNALLKVVEEPPEHVRFVFATTEPEKVIGTIRSRTHHFPFRLIPPALMLEYVEGLCAVEGVTAEPGVLPLVVRAGGGSARDTLSLLDQIMAGSEQRVLDYGRAAALLGFTGRELLDETIDAITAGSAAACFVTVDRVLQSGQDPRRFVEDLLEHVRDLIIAKATGEGAASVLRGASPEELDRLLRQAARLSPASLSLLADLVNASLSEMTGATSPRVHLELMMARLLVELDAGSGGEPGAGGDGAPRSSGQAAARDPGERQRAAPEPAGGQPPQRQSPPGTPPERGVPAEARRARARGTAEPAGEDRFEGMQALLMGAPATAVPADPGARESLPREPGSQAPRGERHAGPERGSPGGSGPESGGRGGDGPARPRRDPAEPVPPASAPPGPVSAEPARAEPASTASASAGSASAGSVSAGPAAASPAVAGPDPAVPAPAGADRRTGQVGAGGGPARSGAAQRGPGPEGQGPGEGAAAVPRGLDLAQLRDAWPSILAQVKREGGIDAWTAVRAIQPRELVGDLLRFEVMNRGELERFKRSGSGGSSPAELLRGTIAQDFGVSVRFQPRVADERQRQRSSSAPGPADDVPGGGGSEPSGQVPQDSPAPAAPGASAAAAARGVPGEPPATGDSAAPVSDADDLAGMSWTVRSIPGRREPGEGPGSAWAEASVPAGARDEPSPDSQAASAGGRGTAGRTAPSPGADDAAAAVREHQSIAGDSLDEPPFPDPEGAPGADEPGPPVGEHAPSGQTPRPPAISGREPTPPPAQAGPPAGPAGIVPDDSVPGGSGAAAGELEAPAGVQPGDAPGPRAADVSGTAPQRPRPAEGTGSARDEPAGAPGSPGRGPGPLTAPEPEPEPVAPGVLAQSEPAATALTGDAPAASAAAPAVSPDRSQSLPDVSAPAASAPGPVTPAPAPAPPVSASALDGLARYGEPVLREILGARFVSEEPLPEEPVPARPEAFADPGEPPYDPRYDGPPGPPDDGED